MPTALTFFSGAGGMCAGLAQAGFDIIGGDIWDANHPGLKCDRRSILDIPIEDWPYADLYHFSPPCQQHSQGNPNRTTGTDDEDTAIAKKIASIIIYARDPQWITLENVPAYQKSKSWRIILTALSIAGYSVEAKVVNAYDYGNPQKRERFIVRAGLAALQGFPDDWFWPGAESTAAKAIGNAVPVQLAKAIGLSLLT
jgi:DNA (cytosine-5)-methyltransferase 1